jgi:histidine triad (HIT) family protein
MKNCFFCKVASHEIKSSNIFFEDEKVIAMLDIDWAVKGHSLIVWKKHELNMSDLSEKDFLHFSNICRKVEARLLNFLNVDKSVILKSGGLESHFHFHIYPIKSDISWEAVRDMFEKKVKYEPAQGEKEELLGSLEGL